MYSRRQGCSCPANADECCAKNQSLAAALAIQARASVTRSRRGSRHQRASSGALKASQKIRAMSSRPGKSPRLGRQTPLSAGREDSQITAGAWSGAGPDRTAGSSLSASGAGFQLSPQGATTDRAAVILPDDREIIASRRVAEIGVGLVHQPGGQIDIPRPGGHRGGRRRLMGCGAAWTTQLVQPLNQGSCAGSAGNAASLPARGAPTGRTDTVRLFMPELTPAPVQPTAPAGSRAQAQHRQTVCQRVQSKGGPGR